MTEHNAYREVRKSSMYWVRKAAADIEALELIEDIMPSFVKRRYTISSLHKSETSSMGNIELFPYEADKDDVKAADILHADVGKLFDYLFSKCEDRSVTPPRPTRRLAWNGLIQYTFRLVGLPGYEAHLDVTVSGIPAGSACRVVKKVTANRMVQDFEYEMECDDEQGGEELEAKAVEETEPSEVAS